MDMTERTVRVRDLRPFYGMALLLGADVKADAVVTEEITLRAKKALIGEISEAILAANFKAVLTEVHNLPESDVPAQQAIIALCCLWQNDMDPEARSE